MRHYLLTRSAYAPTVPIALNRKRLALTRGVTARSLAAQTLRDVTWVVMVDDKDPLYAERVEVLRSAGLPLILAPPGNIVRDAVHDVPWGPWSENLERDGPTLTTRIDDDDAFAPWVFETVRRKAEEWTRRQPRRRLVLILPCGWRVASGRINERHDRVSQFSTLYAPRNDQGTVMDMNHTRVRKLGRLGVVSVQPGWLWLRHEATRSRNSRASMNDRDHMVHIPDQVRRQFPVDWDLIEALP